MTNKLLVRKISGSPEAQREPETNFKMTSLRLLETTLLLRPPNGKCRISMIRWKDEPGYLHDFMNGLMRFELTALLVKRSDANFLSTLGTLREELDLLVDAYITPTTREATLSGLTISMTVAYYSIKKTNWTGRVAVSMLSIRVRRRPTFRFK